MARLCCCRVSLMTVLLCAVTRWNRTSDVCWLLCRGSLPGAWTATYNFICEIPKWTRKKMEIATRELYNPIKQDTNNGRLREYLWGDMLFNYGAFPQTWEDPAHVTPDTGAKGDNDPLGE